MISIEANISKAQLRIIIGRNIRNKRLEQHMSVDELSSMLDITPGYLGLIERGRRGVTAYNFHRLSVIFEIGINEFFFVPIGIVPTNEKPDERQQLRKKIQSFTKYMTISQLEFIADMIKGLKNIH